MEREFINPLLHVSSNKLIIIKKWSRALSKRIINNHYQKKRIINNHDEMKGRAESYFPQQKRKKEL